MTLAAPPILDPAALVQLRAERPEVRLPDVRTPAEFEMEHIAGAYNVPLDTLAEHGAEIRATVADPVVLVCRSGQRARRADEALRAAGMRNLHLLEGGMSAWVAAGLPVHRGAPRMSLERQVRIVAGLFAAAGGILALLVTPWFALIPALLGTGLVVAGLRDSCLMGMALARLPYNRPASCDVPAMVRALTAGDAPARAPLATGSRADGVRCNA